MGKGLGNLNPKFWYIDEQEEISKYIYCRLCHAGPFKESDKKIKFNFYGLGNKNPYCTACAITLQFFQNTVPFNYEKEESEGDRKSSSPAIQEKFSEEDIEEL